MKPSLSYTIWFSQRTGSTLLCKALEATGLAGKPNEWLNVPSENILEHYGVRNYAELQECLWMLGSTPNEVCGLKFSFYQPHFNKILDIFRKFPASAKAECSRTDIWNHAFPNTRHIFMTRRNKVRLAVSWWKAIKTQEWHRENNQGFQSFDLKNAYSFDAIYHLFCECTMREAGVQEFFSEGKIVPLTIVYEDFIENYEGTVRNVLDFLGLDPSSPEIISPYYVRLSDEISEEWSERFRHELQEGWQNQGW